MYLTLQQYLHTALITLPSSHSMLKPDESCLVLCVTNKMISFFKAMLKIYRTTLFCFCFYQFSHGKSPSSTCKDLKEKNPVLF